ncbi:hypothetical protein K505DRAFT_365130 [Melanomma pulvis-pyrius CBS 109.77]|uniref:Uncharacterized protein n=1 Tax=Melanomma pulvis-pyrius CBS 109.77 TaxID=1314802 RepID=A0A6A6X1H2_9PLEO|nr:hypothetical protein K505DRAFT_365130 [Melanomma pulvis-pyrius CBS 109.77]
MARRVSRTRSPRPGSLARIEDDEEEETLGPRPVTLSPTRVRFKEEGGRGRKVKVPELPSLNMVVSLLSEDRGSSPPPSTPASPKLHHIHGLPRAKDYPYVHKREVARHLAAQQAGLPSPISSTRTSPTRRGIPETVFYRRGVPPVPRSPGRPKARSNIHTHANLPMHSELDIREPTPYSPISLHPLPGLDPRPRRNRNPQSLTSSCPPTRTSPSTSPLSANISPFLPATTTLESIQAVGSVTVDSDGRLINLDLELQNSSVYSRAQSPASVPARNNEGDGDGGGESSSSSGGGTMPETPSTVAGRRLELRGGREESSAGPKLRGGEGRRTPVLLRVKRGLLTCRGGLGERSVGLDESSEDEGPATPVYVGRGSVKRPRSSEGHCGTDGRKKETKGRNQNEGRLGVVPSPSTSSSPSIRATLSHSNFHFSTPHQHQHPHQPIPSLRGGSGGLRDRLQDSDVLPSGLWYLAGGTEAPITVRQWRRQRPKRRMGGLLGMAIFGRRAGMAYEDTEEGEGVVSGGTEGGRSSSSSSLKSSTSSSSKPKSTAASSKSNSSSPSNSSTSRSATKASKVRSSKASSLDFVFGSTLEGGATAAPITLDERPAAADGDVNAPAEGNGNGSADKQVTGIPFEDHGGGDIVTGELNVRDGPTGTTHQEEAQRVM